jgi:hypothetical protein
MLGSDSLWIFTREQDLVCPADRLEDALVPRVVAAVLQLLQVPFERAVQARCVRRIFETMLCTFLKLFLFLIQFHSCGLMINSWNLVVFRVITNQLTFAIVKSQQLGSVFSLAKQHSIPRRELHTCCYTCPSFSRQGGSKEMTAPTGAIAQEIVESSSGIAKASRLGFIQNWGNGEV